MELCEKEDFHRIGPLGRFDLVVAKSVHLCVCVFVPFPCHFFRGLSLALRSHDQIPASHWRSKVDPKSGGQKWTPKVAVKKGPQKWRSKVDPKSGGQKWTPKVAQPLQNCIGPTFRIDREILCFPYAGFFILIWGVCQKDRQDS